MLGERLRYIFDPLSFKKDVFWFFILSMVLYLFKNIDVLVFQLEIIP